MVEDLSNSMRGAQRLRVCASRRRRTGQYMARAFLDGGVQQRFGHGDLQGLRAERWSSFSASSTSTSSSRRLDLFASCPRCPSGAESASAQGRSVPSPERAPRLVYSPSSTPPDRTFPSFRERQALEKSSSARNAHLPREPTRDELVIGRDFDLLRFEQKLLKHKRIFLTAPPGFGKTVFLKWACKIWNATKFRDSVIYADLAATELREPAGLLKLLMEELSDPEEDDPSEEVQDYVANVLGVPYDQKANAITVINILSKRQAILVLDGLHTFRFKGR